MHNRLIEIEKILTENMCLLNIISAAAQNKGLSDFYVMLEVLSEKQRKALNLLTDKF